MIRECKAGVTLEHSGYGSQIDKLTNAQIQQKLRTAFPVGSYRIGRQWDREADILVEGVVLECFMQETLPLTVL